MNVFKDLFQFGSLNSLRSQKNQRQVTEKYMKFIFCNIKTEFEDLMHEFFRFLINSRISY